MKQFSIHSQHGAQILTPQQSTVDVLLDENMGRILRPLGNEFCRLG
jgi:hypothetical protein